MMLLDGAVDIRHGPWQTALADVEWCDALICDPPFSARTHDGQRVERKDAAYSADAGTGWLAHRGIEYAAFDEFAVHELAAAWAPRVKAWTCCFTSHDLVPAYEEAFADRDRYAFAPVSCVQMHRNVRISGDGPSNWSDSLCVSRPRSLSKWGALPGAYVGKAFDIGENSLDRSKRIVPGAKPLWLMRSIIRDYTRPGDLVVDPFCGGGTTALACAIEGRRCITSEIDLDTFNAARARIARGFTKDLFA